MVPFCRLVSNPLAMHSGVRRRVPLRRLVSTIFLAASRTPLLRILARCLDSNILAMDSGVWTFSVPLRRLVSNALATISGVVAPPSPISTLRLAQLSLSTMFHKTL